MIKKNIAKEVKPQKTKYGAPAGWLEAVPQSHEAQEFLNSIIRGIVEPHGYGYMEPSMVESREACVRMFGKDSTIVNKELITLSKRGGDDCVLRPDYRLSYNRAYLEHDLGAETQPVKVYSIGSVFRATDEGKETRVMALEILANERPATDSEIIHIVYRILERAQLGGLVETHVNSAGCSECRPGYKQTLKDYYRSHRQKLCAECRKNFTEDPRKLLTCTEEKCKRFAMAAPQAVDSLCDPCRKHFQLLLETLDELEVPYILNSRVIGAEYMNRTVISVVTSGEQPIEIAEGGRHDGVFKVLGGQPQGAVGIQLYLDRVRDFITSKNIVLPHPAHPQVFLAQLGELAKKKSMKLFEQLYGSGIAVYESFGRDSLKSQIKLAQKLEVSIMLILGQKEAVDETILFREMRDGVQEIVAQDKLVEMIKKRLASE